MTDYTATMTGRKSRTMKARAQRPRPCSMCHEPIVKGDVYTQFTESWSYDNLATEFHECCEYGSVAENPCEHMARLRARRAQGAGP